MAEAISRALRDGGLDGEHAPALCINDSTRSPFGPLLFDHLLAQLSSNVLAGKSQSQGLVLVCLSRSPSFYDELLKRRGNDGDSLSKWLRVLDCYTDPLGWKDQLFQRGIIKNKARNDLDYVRLCKDLKNLDLLSKSIIELGKELVGIAKGHFSVAIDSATDLLRDNSLYSVSTLLSDIRSHVQVSSAFWVLHSDTHDDRVTAAFEYLSSMLASIETSTPSSMRERGDSEQNSRRGKLHVRLKRRNGRVRIMTEAFSIEQSEIKFEPVSSDGGMNAQTLVPKVQFNLQLSEKERADRAKVVLPFEHQGNGKPIEIYDGRRSLNENDVDINSTSSEKLNTNSEPGKGEIIYFRDSDDEMPDSDEDPDDDLDI